MVSHNPIRTNTHRAGRRHGGFPLLAPAKRGLDACMSACAREDSREIARNGGTMISSEVQRTLVKSPPELWAEISDPDSLARHLGEFGEIRITRVQPEQKVEWETDDASGTVVIKPSGWGTKVKLTVMRELAELDAQSDPEAHATAVGDAEQTDDGQEQDEMHAPEPAHEPGRSLAPDGAAEPNDEVESDVDDATILEPALVLKDGSLVEPETPAELVAEVEQQEEADRAPAPEPEPRRSFFARLFGRRRARRDELGPDALAEPESEPEQLESEPVSEGLNIPRPDYERDSELTADRAPMPSEEANELPMAHALPVGAHPPDAATQAAEQPLDARDDSAGPSEGQVHADDAAAQAKLAEELAAEEVTAVLAGVLDRLGAAHHRPFSRA